MSKLQFDTAKTRELILSHGRGGSISAVSSAYISMLFANAIIFVFEAVKIKVMAY